MGSLVGVIVNLQGIGFSSSEAPPSILRFRCTSCNQPTTRLSPVQFSCSTCRTVALSICYTARLTMVVGCAQIHLIMWDAQVRALLGLEASHFFLLGQTHAGLEGLVRQIYCSRLARVQFRPGKREGDDLVAEDVDLPWMRDVSLLQVLGCEGKRTAAEEGERGGKRLRVTP